VAQHRNPIAAVSAALSEQLDLAGDQVRNIIIRKNLDFEASNRARWKTR
jgi:hypothetical protein